MIRVYVKSFQILNFRYLQCIISSILSKYFFLKLGYSKFSFGNVYCFFHSQKERRALRGYFGPPMMPKNEIPFSPNSSYCLFRTMTQVYKSDISLTFTDAMVTKMAAKTG